MSTNFRYLSARSNFSDIFPHLWASCSVPAVSLRSPFCSCLSQYKIGSCWKWIVDSSGLSDKVHSEWSSSCDLLRLRALSIYLHTHWSNIIKEFQLHIVLKRCIAGELKWFMRSRVEKCRHVIRAKEWSNPLAALIALSSRSSGAYHRPTTIPSRSILQMYGSCKKV